MNKHTPGPWSRVTQTQGGDLIAREIKTENQLNPKALRLICFMMMRGNSLHEDEANASLIAAAPELLEALEAFLRAPSIGSNGMGSVSIEVQDFNLKAAHALLARINA